MRRASYVRQGRQALGICLHVLRRRAKVDAADCKLSVLPLTQERVFRLTPFSLAAGICLQKLAL